MGGRQREPRAPLPCKAMPLPLALQVIHPVGPIPREVLDGYVDVISRFKHVSLSASRSFYQDPPTKTPFQYLDWNNGYMHFRFLKARS